MTFSKLFREVLGCWGVERPWERESFFSDCSLNVFKPSFVSHEDLEAIPDVSPMQKEDNAFDDNYSMFTVK